MSGPRSRSFADAYSPERRTALVLTGTGTAGAYHAGVLKALHEAGVKIDIAAGRGIGAVGALFAAVDGASQLWNDKGFWRAPGVRSLYRWHPLVGFAGWALALAVALVAVPLAAMAAGLIVFPIDFLLKMVGIAAGGGLVARYVAFAQAMFAPGALPTWLPRLVLLVLGLAAAAVAGTAIWTHRDKRQWRGPGWWRLAASPISTRPVVDRFWSVMWDLIRGAAQLSPPTPIELARRYVELLKENLGQPGFRELVIVAHDVDARSDLVFALVGEARRAELVRRPTTREADRRRAEVVDLAGVGGDHLVDAVAASLTIPIATDFHPIRLAAESYWRGETHRICDRPASLLRLVDELIQLGAEQVILVTAAEGASEPHRLVRPQMEGRGRLGEYLQSAEAAVVQDVTRSAAGRTKLFSIQPGHNPIGPLDSAGGFDDRSDRRQGIAELMSRGYEDAYHQFIEPVVGASGERVGTA